MRWGDYFSGGGLATVGAQQAGLVPVFGVEYDADIANVYAHNLGKRVKIADVCEVDPLDLPPVDWFHASPPCINASIAKTDGGETGGDMALARAVIRYVTTHRPPFVSIENVWGYRKFDAFLLIVRALQDAGYAADYWHLNAADYGVPQTRKRLILVARRDGKRPRRPSPTHYDDTSGQLDMLRAP